MADEPTTTPPTPEKAPEPPKAPEPTKAYKCPKGHPLAPFDAPTDPYGRAATGFCDKCGDRFPLG